MLRGSGPNPLAVGGLAVSLAVLVWASPGLLAKTGVMALISFVAFSWPLPFLMAALALAAGLDYSLGVNLPVLVQLSGFRVTTTDALVVLVTVIGFVELLRRREGPVFWKPLALLFVCVSVSWAVGTASGTTDFHRGLNELRYLEPYALYIAGVGIVDSRTRLTALKHFCFAAIVLSVVRQVWEIAGGHAVGETTVEIAYSRTLVPYVRLALVEFVLVGAVVAFSLLLSRGFRPVLFVLTAVAIVGIGVQLSRQWYGFVAVALLTVVILRKPRKKLQAITISVLLAGIVAVLVPAVESVIAPNYGGSVVGVISSRFGEISEQGLTTQSAMVRILTNQQMWTFFESAPVFGLGPGQSFEDSRFFFNDVGGMNTLVRFGAVGLAAVLVLVLAVLVRARKTMRQGTEDELEAYIAAAFGVLLAFLTGYSFSQDFFTLFPTGTVFAMILIDRATAFSRPRFLDSARVRPISGMAARGPQRVG